VDSWSGVPVGIVAGGAIVWLPEASIGTVNSAVWTDPACWKSRNKLYVAAVGKVVPN
jgi:hypothetical protein